MKVGGLILGLQAMCFAIPGQAEPDICERSQLLVENLNPDFYASLEVSTETLSGLRSFLLSKPSLRQGGVELKRFNFQGEAAPAQTWCKMKSRQAIGNYFDVPFEKEARECASANQLVLDAALANLSPEDLQKYENGTLKLELLEDQEFSRGSGWSRSYLRINRDSPGKIQVEASSLWSRRGIPFVGGMRYCKLLAAETAEKLIQEVIQSADNQKDLDHDFMEVDTGKNKTNLYLPKNIENAPLVILLQGAKVDRKDYSTLGKILARQGIAVAVPNHRSLYGENMTQQVVFNRVWDYLKTASMDPGSNLFGRIATSKVSLMGHSLGGIASLRIMQNKCQLPTCFGNYTQPEELAAVIIFGTSSRTPVLGGFADVVTGGMPLMFIQGELDSISKLEHGRKTFLEKTEGSPVVFVELKGANHYGLCNTNNPEGPVTDRTEPEIDQKLAVRTVAKWTTNFLLASVLQDSSAEEFIYEGVGDESDTWVKVLTK